MADLADLTVGQEIVLEGTILSIDPLDRHFTGITVQLARPEDTELDPILKFRVQVDPSQVTIPEVEA